MAPRAKYEITGISKSFAGETGPLQAIADVSLTVHEGNKAHCVGRTGLAVCGPRVACTCCARAE